MVFRGAIFEHSYDEFMIIKRKQTQMAHLLALVSN